MSIRKGILAIVAGVAVGAFALSTSAAPRGTAQKGDGKDGGIPRAPKGQQAVPAVVENTGFEVPDWDAYTPGQSNDMCGINYWGTCQPTPIPASCTGVPATDINCCVGAPNPLNSWYKSASSQHCREPHIDIIHPASGTQHLRFTRDPLGGNPAGCTGIYNPDGSQNTACREAVFTPFLASQPIANTRIDFDVSGDAAFGSLFEFDTQGTGATTGVGTIVYFVNTYNYLYIYNRERVGGAGFQKVGNWLPDGNYHHFHIDKNICAGTLQYFYDGVLVLATGMTGESYGVNQAVMLESNGVSNWDIDNYAIERDPPCPTICGQHGVEPGEQCDPSAPGVGCPLDRCDPVTCQCSQACTFNDPCILHNGPNGPFYAPFDPQFAAIFLYQSTTPFVEIDTCGSNKDTQIFFWGSANNGADPGNSNDDCCDPADPTCGAAYGAGSDPNAACYNNVGAPPNLFNSCTCYGIPDPADTLYLAQIGSGGGIPPLGTILNINVEKKAACAGTVLGSCCDSNGADVGCTDDVAQSACQGLDKSFSLKKCADRAACVCVPLCTGRVCGPDGCGGTCAPNSCSDNNVCNGVETCDEQTGQCVAGTPLVCDDHVACNGVETCDPVNGCQPGTPVNCDDHIACTADACTEPNGTCTHTPNNGACDDGLACNGLETCVVGTGCTPGTPVNCDDGVACTVDSCVEPAGTCAHDSTACFTPIPTVSQWGIAVMALLLLIGAKIYFSRRQNTTA